jgi:Tol biopolymer transport system component
VNHRFLAVLTVSAVVLGCGSEAAEDTPAADVSPAANLAGEGIAIHFEGESHLQNVRQLTAGGQNAEAYWAFDGSALIYQAKKEGMECDQIFVLDPHTAETSMVSTGEGRTTCSYFYPSGDEIIYSSTHHHDAFCPAEPDFSQGYVWPIYKTYDVFIANADGSNLRQLTTEDGYDAEATVSPTGDRVVFTSDRNGDLDLYSMNLDGTDVVQLTNRLGYDGGAFYSPDGSQIIWRAHYPEEGSPEAADYVRLLQQGLIRPSTLEVYVMDADGSNIRQVTDVGGANFAPFWHPDGDKILWSSNHHDPAGREFDIFMINLDGTGMQQITHSAEFDGFPVFSPDGRYLAFASNRNNGGGDDTNVFIAEWVN